jgi:hypothetical protein
MIIPMEILRFARLKRILQFNFWAVLVLTFSACKKKKPEASAIIGSVENMENGDPVNQAFVLNDDVLLGTKDASGRFEIPAPDPGIYNLVFSALGFMEKNHELVVGESGAAGYLSA